MQAVNMLPEKIDGGSQEETVVISLCKIIEQLSQSGKDRRALQKVAGDIMAVEKLAKVIVGYKKSSEEDSEMSACGEDVTTY